MAKGKKAVKLSFWILFGITKHILDLTKEKKG